ncbi:MAG: 4Fe-4S binding protein [Clostridiales bacterium]|nr:4Fe-4S binding protein [Clostridiales bacterium]
MEHQYIKNVATLQLDTDKCTGCKMCTFVCPHNVFEVQNRKSVIVDLDKCMECGACAHNCAFDAITVKPGVGCAFAIVRGILTNSEPNCGCDDDGACC